MKPLLIYDGDCDFCLYWIRICKNQTQDRVDYAPYQSLGTQYSQIPKDQLERSVQLVKPDGETTEGAKAMFETLGYNQDLAWLLRIYHKFPPFAAVAEAVYYFVARNRRMLSSLLKWYIGNK